jgi:hypothetical protein
MKKIIIIASVILVCIIIILSFILRKKSTTNNPLNSPFPTSIPGQESNKQIDSNLSNLSNSSNLPIDISIIEPVETEDFKLQYSLKQNKIIVEKKTLQAEEQFINWVSQNQLTQLIENPELTLIVDSGQNPDDFNPLLEFLNIFMNFGQGPNNQSSITSSPALPNPPNSPNSPNSSPTYYSQCNGFGDTQLPDGCNLCQAGCGPTTVAMIAASYLGNNFTPKTMVDTYQSKSYLLGCAGSRYSDARETLKSLGLKTTDYLVYNFETADQIVSDLKKYLDAGWTFFTLASFREVGGGHYFWITDIDDQGNIFAYDPYYGRYEIPYNENSRYPYPLYRLTFGVKK